MLIVVCLSLHIFLILLYAIAIEIKLSRHSYIQLLFAAAVPFVGELCLLASEFGRTDSAFEPEKLFGKPSANPHGASQGAMPYTLPITRETLLAAIEAKPKNLTEILQHGVTAEDIEVAHIAAATIMKMQREHENRISSLREKHLALKDNMKILREYIDAVGAYHASGLLQGKAADELLTRQEELLNLLLRVLPHDQEARSLLAANRAAQKKS